MSGAFNTFKALDAFWTFLGAWEWVLIPTTSFIEMCLFYCPGFRIQLEYDIIALHVAVAICSVDVIKMETCSER